MGKEIANYFVDLALVLVFLSSGITGLLKFPGFLGLFGYNYKYLQQFGLNQVHDFSSILLVLLVLVHLALNFPWLAAMTKKVFFGGRSK
jgi:hypothetical protein